MIESNERYVPPTIKTVEISTRTCILQVSGTSYNGGSGSDNNGFGYDMD